MRDHWTMFAVHQGQLALRSFAYNITVERGQIVVLPPYRHGDHGPANKAAQVLATEVGFDIIPQVKNANPLARIGLPVTVACDHWDELQQYCARVEDCFQGYRRRGPQTFLTAPPWLGLLLTAYLEEGFARSLFRPARHGVVPQWLEVLEGKISNHKFRPQPRGLHRLSGFSRAYVDTNFKKHFGVTPRQHWHRCRLELAMEWLTSRPEMSLAEIATECGYSTQSLFNRHFRRLTGQTPGEFRRAHPAPT
jgi:AraC-like DNA-binding protein